MEFLKSAVASAVSRGPPFPYTFGDRVDIDDSIWALHNGTKRASYLSSHPSHLDFNKKREEKIYRNSHRLMEIDLGRWLKM